MNIYLAGLTCSIVFSGVAFVSTNNLIVTICVGLASFIYFFFIGSKVVKKTNVKIQRFHECYYFINNFIVSLSIKGSVKNALESASNYVSNELDSVLNGIKDLSELEKVRYLQKYFKFHLYALFVDLLYVYIDEGGDILKMSNYLINQSRITEEYIIKASQMNKRKIFEFITLWIFSLIILIVLRFALSQFYSFLVKQIFYQIGVGVIFLFILFSIHILTIKINELDLRGWIDEK